jgi:hypothetical protein
LHRTPYGSVARLAHDGAPNISRPGFPFHRVG